MCEHTNTDSRPCAQSDIGTFPTSVCDDTTGDGHDTEYREEGGIPPDLEGVDKYRPQEDVEAIHLEIDHGGKQSKTRIEEREAQQQERERKRDREKERGAKWWMIGHSSRKRETARWREDE